VKNKVQKEISSDEAHPSAVPPGDGRPKASAQVSQEKLMLSIPEVGLRLGIGRTSVYGLIKRGTLKTIKLGTRTLIPAEDIMQFVAELKRSQNAPIDTLGFDRGGAQ
jgi:excisionase family DNA binding protein